MHRFYTASPLPASGQTALARDAAHRITRVLRLTPGERVRLFDGSGREVEGLITAVSKDAVAVELVGELPPTPPEPVLVLYQALIRPNRFEWLLEKATELGVSAVQPVVSERSQVRATEFGAAKASRWRRILVEAAEQCGRRTVPELHEPIPFARALEQAEGLLVLPWEETRTQAPLLGETLRSTLRHATEAPRLSIFIGPEGGFTEAEAGAARERGALVVSLGPRILRAETAAIAALAIAGEPLPASPSPR